MPRHERVGLYYRQRHLLAVGDSRWDIQAVRHLSGKVTSPRPDPRIDFGIELSLLDADWQAAIARARRIDSALIDGIPARVTLQKVELHFSRSIDQAESDGVASFAAVLDQPMPFPRSLDDTEFVRALAQAGEEAGDLRIQADEIEVTERYWIFPIHNIGANGVIVDRVTEHAFTTNGSFDRSTWIWAYEHRLLDEPAGDVVVARISDRERAFAALKQFARVCREDLENLPLVLEGCAMWTAARHLREADCAITWRVEPRA